MSSVKSFTLDDYTLKSIDNLSSKYGINARKVITKSVKVLELISFIPDDTSKTWSSNEFKRFLKSF